MAELPVVKVLVRPRPGGYCELSCVDARSGREVRTGLVVGRGALDGEIRKLKLTLERAGNHVQVREL
jgi:hypothetical protein